MNCQKLKRKLRSAFSKEDMKLTLSLLNKECWKYKGSLKEWISKCLYYFGSLLKQIIDKNNSMEYNK